MHVSIVKGFTHVSEDVDYDEIVRIIKDGDMSKKVSRIRELLKDYRLWQAASIKRGLPAFTPSATFSKYRALGNIKVYNGIIHLDYDGIKDPHRLFLICNKIKDWPYTFMSFISPSGTGIKLFVRTDSWWENHKETWERVNRHYTNLLEIKGDEKCKDITRLCFLSHDPNIYYNPDSNIFEVDN